MKWINVDDELPKIEKDCWRAALPVNVIVDRFGQYLCYPCRYGNGVFYWADALRFGDGTGDHPESCGRGTEVLNVTHWMPLPEPPTLENTNAN